MTCKLGKFEFHPILASSIYLLIHLKPESDIRHEKETSIIIVNNFPFILAIINILTREIVKQCQIIQKIQISLVSSPLFWEIENIQIPRLLQSNLFMGTNVLLLVGGLMEGCKKLQRISSMSETPLKGRRILSSAPSLPTISQGSHRTCWSHTPIS